MEYNDEKNKIIKRVFQYSFHYTLLLRLMTRRVYICRYKSRVKVMMYILNLIDKSEVYKSFNKMHVGSHRKKTMEAYMLLCVHTSAGAYVRVHALVKSVCVSSRAVRDYLLNSCMFINMALCTYNTFILHSYMHLCTMFI